jgi:hypothetical protein
MTVAVGSASLDKGSIIASANNTCIEKNGPAPVALRADTLSVRNHRAGYNITDLYIGSFYNTGGLNYKCRDATYCGFVAADSVGVFTGKSLLFEIGDLIGAFFSVDAARFSIHATDGIGWVYAGGQHCVKDDVALYSNELSPTSLRLNGSGEQIVTSVTTVSPSLGLQGATDLIVVITGAEFTGATAVSFGAGITVTTFVVDSDTQITATLSISKAAVPGTRDVSVTGVYGEGTLAAGFTVLAAGHTSHPVHPTHPSHPSHGGGL